MHAPQKSTKNTPQSKNIYTAVRLELHRSSPRVTPQSIYMHTAVLFLIHFHPQKKTTNSHLLSSVGMGDEISNFMQDFEKVVAFLESNRIAV